MKCAVVTGAGTTQTSARRAEVERIRGSMLAHRSLLGATIGAAMLALLAVAPVHRPGGQANLADLVPLRPSVQARFASALRTLGEVPQATGFERGTLVAMVRPVAPSAGPSIRIDAAIGA